MFDSGLDRKINLLNREMNAVLEIESGLMGSPGQAFQALERWFAKGYASFYVKHGLDSEPEFLQDLAEIYSGMPDSSKGNEFDFSDFLKCCMAGGRDYVLPKLFDLVNSKYGAGFSEKYVAYAERRGLAAEAKSLVIQGNLEQAREKYGQMLENDPDDLIPVLGLEFIDFLQNRPGAAAAAAEEKPPQYPLRRESHVIAIPSDGIRPWLSGKTIKFLKELGLETNHRGTDYGF